METLGVIVGDGSGSNDGSGISGVRTEIADPMSAHPSKRHVFLRTLEFCQMPRPTAEVDRRIGDLLGGDSLYSPVVLREWLESAGTLERLEDSREALADPPAAPTLWVTTEAGRATLLAHEPERLLPGLLGSEADFRDAFLSVLSLCVEPKTKAEIEELLSDHSALQRPRVFPAYLLRRLEEVGAIEWNGSKWSTTEAGSAALMG